MKIRVASSLAALALFTIALLVGGCGCCGSGCDGDADLSLSKSVSDDAPNVGDTITFTVTLTNNGPDAATRVRVLDLLPTGLTFVSAVASQGTYDAVAGIWTVGGVAVGTPLTLTIQATVASPSPQTNTATIGAVDQSDPSLGNNTASATEIPSSQADLSLEKSVSDATPNVGDTITFTVTLTNSGPAPATNVEVQDPLPVGLSFVSATPSVGTYTPATGVWAVSSVAVATPQTLAIAATVVSPSAQTNTATITGVDQFDPDTSDDAASATETPQQADLALTKTVSDSTPNVGDTITFTITLTNSGPDPATDVQVQDLLPTGVSFIAATPSLGTYDPATGLWDVGTVTVGTPQTLVVLARVVSPDPQTNTAALGSADQFDPNVANNAAGATETPQQADLALIKTVSDPTPTVGDTITFTVTLTNSGPDAATNVVVQDLLPIGLTFVSATLSQGSYSNLTGVWNVGTVTVSTPQTLTLVATVVSASAQTNTATISGADQFDPNTANNTASATETP